MHDATTPAIAAPPRAFRSPAAWLTLLLVLAAGLAADLASKSWAFRTVAGAPVELDRQAILANPRGLHVPWHQPKKVIGPDILNLRLVINHGAVFGIGQQKRVFFIAFTVAAIGVGVLIFARWTSSRQRLAHVALGLILAGGVGNLYDRWSFAVVRDFLHLLPERKLPFGWNWPGGSEEIFPWVFNLADVMLLGGMGLMMIHINRAESRSRRKANASANDSTTIADVPAAASSAAAKSEAAASD